MVNVVGLGGGATLAAFLDSRWYEDWYISADVKARTPKLTRTGSISLGVHFHVERAPEEPGVAVTQVTQVREYALALRHP